MLSYWPGMYLTQDPNILFEFKSCAVCAGEQTPGEAAGGAMRKRPIGA